MSAASTNRFLGSLSSSACDLLMAHTTAVDLPLRTQLYKIDERPASAYFLLSGMASIVMATEDGDTAEVGIIAKDGLVGGLHLLGPAKISTDCFMQIEGSGLRISWNELRKVYQQSSEVRDRILEFQQEQALVTKQLAGCNRLHEVEARLARWLLMASDQTGTHVLNLTQEFLGMMLGARRTTVSLVAGTLQRLGTIEFSRGRVSILNRDALEEVSCDCYQVIKNLNTNLYAKEIASW